MDTPPIFFIVGKGRSGTTLLQCMLDAHPHLVVPWESRIILELKSRYAECVDWSVELKNEFVKDLFLDDKFRWYWGLGLDRLEIEIQKVQIASFAQAIKWVYSQFPSLHPSIDVRLIGDKNPVHTHFMLDLLEIFPEARFIHLVRDPRTNVRSHLQLRNKGQYERIAWRWRAFVGLVESFRSEYPDRVLELRYEDLLQDTEGSLRAVCEFLEIGYSDDMLSFHEVDEGVKVGWLDSLEATARLRLDQFQAGMYKKLDVSRLRSDVDSINGGNNGKIESICYAEMRRYHYPMTRIKLRNFPLWKRLYRKAAFWIWRNGIVIFYRLPLGLRLQWKKLKMIAANGRG